MVRAADEPLTALYRGEINADTNRRFLESLRGKRIQRLIIDSPGGDVSAGINLGRWVFQNGIVVVIEHQCLSSCANYLFPAGRRKIIRQGAIVAWHGNYHHLEATGLWADDIASRMARTGEDRGAATAIVKQQMQELVRKERDFFQLIGVDQRLCWVGKMPPYSVPDYYTLSETDMLRYGVHSIITEGEYRDTDLNGFDVDIRWVGLDGLAP